MFDHFVQFIIENIIESGLVVGLGLDTMLTSPNSIHFLFCFFMFKPFYKHDE